MNRFELGAWLEGPSAVRTSTLRINKWWGCVSNLVPSSFILCVEAGKGLCRVKRILYATDGSKSAQTAGRMAADIMNGFPETQLIVLYVSTELAYPYNVGIEDYMEAERARSEEIETSVREELLPEFSLRTKFRYEIGRPALVICEVANQEDVDLVIVGSHGRNAIDRMFLGSVSNAVLQRSKQPVLVVKGE
jgi:nucleotide-binding universal stress UspA family protein